MSPSCNSDLKTDYKEKTHVALKQILNMTKQVLKQLTISILKNKNNVHH